MSHLMTHMNLDISHNEDSEDASVRFQHSSGETWTVAVEKDSDEYAALLDAIDGIWSAYVDVDDR